MARGTRGRDGTLMLGALAGPQLAGFFAGANMNRLKGMRVEFFADALAAAGVPTEIIGQIGAAITPLSDEIASRGLS